MPSPAVLDIDRLLAPIPGAQATGADLRKDGSPGSAYYAVKDGRKMARDIERQIITPEDRASLPPPDWKSVQEKAIQTLAETTKDLEIVTYLIEALARQAGLPGLRDGLRLACGLIEKYWDGLYPAPDEEGPVSRVRALVAMCAQGRDGNEVARIVRRCPITAMTALGQFTGVDYDTAQALRKTTDAKQRERAIKEGAVPLETIEKAVAETPAEFYGQLVEDIDTCLTHFRQLADLVRQRCADKAALSSAIREALDTQRASIVSLAKSKLDSLAPAPAAKKDEDGKAAEKAAPGAAVPQAAQPGVIQTREDAFRALLEVAEFFRRTEPHTVVSYALEQVVRWGRMPLPDLLSELIVDENSRKTFFKQVGIRPEPAKPAEAAKK
jgi:type VI secretion system protein ImpA